MKFRMHILEKTRKTIIIIICLYKYAKRSHFRNLPSHKEVYVPVTKQKFKRLESQIPCFKFINKSAL
jgi:hypothetical protein